ncbi:unnamed protein product [Candidula unifasciata]|uniref:Uncharacterized protein n=1 Tax=Candidula unifasciata TaxID=100452 RepID=A0A8S3YLJ5_9EUPU|nr:unnamed protein product [Candidula unifasciata]
MYISRSIFCDSNSYSMCVFMCVLCKIIFLSEITNLEGVTTQQQASLSVKGTNVWTLSLEAERRLPNERGTQDLITFSPSSAVKSQVSYLTFCRHERLEQSCRSCEKASGAPAAPPNKKRCRSLSGPPECLTAVPASVGEYSRKVWKPVAVIPPHSSKNITTSFKLLPVISSHCSNGCGCYTNAIQASSQICYSSSIQTSSSGCYTNSTNTSSGSPKPRPASVASDTSFSSIYQDSPRESRVRILENRSLSCEDQISGAPSISSASSDVRDKSSDCDNSLLPRCHSQPCILHHRRCRKKRRRNFQRPALNFHKMTEVLICTHDNIERKRRLKEED